MRDILNLFESVDIVDDHLYHGTSEPADKIRQHGLIPSRHGCVFLTDNPELAIDYAESDQERTGNDNVTLCKIALKDLDLTKLMADVDHTTVDTWEESLDECDQCMYQGNIPASIIDIEEL
jgi:hypothetical protein